MLMIGEGCWSQVFLVSQDVVLIETSCESKARMHRGEYGNSRFFPRLTKVELLNPDVCHPTGYMCDRYEVHDSEEQLLSRLTPTDRLTYKELRAAPKDRGSLRMSETAVDQLMSSMTDPEAKSAMHQATTCLLGYDGEVMLDINYKNVGIDRTGRLVLFDIFVV